MKGIGLTKNQLKSVACIASLAIAALLAAPESSADSAVASTGPATVGAAASAASQTGAAVATADDLRVGRLIQALGSQRYVERREAEQALLEIGMQAFDQIDMATDHSDPEISASCRFLVSELTVRWTRRDDPPEVKSMLANYASEDESRRLAIVEALGSRADRWAIGPLCRIARYDATPVVARQAAVELLRTDDYLLGYTADDALTLHHEIGTSVRPQAEWVRLLAAQIDNPQATREAWLAAIERAAAAAAVQADNQPHYAQIAELLRNLVRLEFGSKRLDNLELSVDRLLNHPNMAMVDEIEQLLTWAAVANAPQVIDLIIERYNDRLSQTKSGLYLIARTRFAQGQQELADSLAERAFGMSAEASLAGGAQDRVAEANKLAEAGRTEWARRELRAAIAEVPEASDTHSRAAIALAQSLHDWQQHAESVEVLAALTGPLQGNSELTSQYEHRVRQSTRGRNDLGRLYTLPELESYQYYFDACRLHAEGDRDAEWQALEKAYKLDDSNADIIIGMYRASEENGERREVAREAVQRRCRALEQSIDDYPYPAYYASNFYNEWAWLVSNTEGDFAKAVRYSHKSLELFAARMAVDRDLKTEDSAGLLDTLGRCYFAAGDYEAAIKYQTEAVGYQPQMRVLQRQLKEFQEALTAGGS